MNSLSEKTTPSNAGERKRNYIMKKPPGTMEKRSANCKSKETGVFFSERKRDRTPRAHKVALPIA